MIVVYNRLLPVKGFKAIMLLGLLFVRRGEQLSPATLNHERIHVRQMLELLVVGFYLLYLLEWLCKLLRYGRRAYRNISFEREAYANEWNADYLQERRRWAWWGCLGK